MIHDQYTEDERWDGDPKGWFKHWNCPKLLSIELWGFSRIGTELESDNEGWTDKEDGEDSDLNECEGTGEQKQIKRVGEHGGDSVVKEATQLPPYHSPEDQEFINGIYHEGWTFEQAYEADQEVAQPETRDLRNMVLSRSRTRPSSTKLTWKDSFM